MKKRIICLCCALTLLIQIFCPGILAADTVPFEGAWASSALIPESDGVMYEVTKDYAIVRDAPYDSGHIENHFHKGEYVKGEIVKNLKFNKWLRFEDADGKICYIYSGNIRKHTVHCWSDIIETPAGRLAICDCGFVSLAFKNNSSANITVDGLEYVKQIILGNYSETHSFTAAFASVLLGLTPVGVLTDIRDLSADVYFCAKGDCDYLSLAVDFLAFVPFLDALRHADSLRSVKVLDAAALAKYSDDLNALKTMTESDALIFDTYSGLKKIYAGKSRVLDIEIHHAIEQRFEGLFDVDTSEYFSTPLWRPKHDNITARWRKAIPYTGGDYTDISFEEMIDAVNYVYSDNSVLRKHTVEWVTEHWAA